MTQDDSAELKLLPSHGFNGNENEAIQNRE